MSREAENQEIKNIIIVIRSLITSTKQNVTLRSLETDYSNIEQEPIPYRRLGYRDLLDFLEDTNAFRFERYGKDIIVSAKPNPKTAHITSMVRDQKCSRSRVLSRPTNVRPNVRPVNNYNNKEKSASNSNNYAQQPYQQQQLLKRDQHQVMQLVQQQAQKQELQLAQIRALGLELGYVRQQQEDQHRHELEIKRIQEELREAQQQQKLQLQKNIDEQFTLLKEQHQRSLEAQAKTIEELQESLKLQNQARERALQHNLQREPEATQAKVEKEEQKHQQAEPKAVKKQKGLPKLNFGNERKKEENPKRVVLTPPSVSPKAANMNGSAPDAGVARKTNLRPILGNSAAVRPSTMQQRPRTDTNTNGGGNNRQLHPRVLYPSPRPGGGSVNYRLKQQSLGNTGQLITPPDSPEIESSKKITSVANVNKPQECEEKQRVISSIQKCPIGNFKFDPACDAISSLKQYCAAMDYAPPAYEFPKAVKDNWVHCRVRIGESIYTSFPEDHSDEETAKLRTSEVAVQRLMMLESRNNLPVLNDDEFVDGLHEELTKHPHGILSHKFPEWYEATVKLQVPRNWWKLITGSPKIRIEKSINTNIILSNSVISGSKQQQDVAIKTMPELQLPWVEGQQDWNMYITHCDNTMHVWARLIDHSAQFEKLTEQVNAHMSQPQNRQPVQQIVEQQIYLVEVSENWNRVQLTSKDEGQRQCICHFVDFGDEVIFSYDSLYLCPEEFLTLPAQAVCLSMYALDKFEEHPHALPVLAKELAGHTVVTRIITSESQFYNSGGRTQGVVLPQKEEEYGCVQPTMRNACIVGTFYDTSTPEDIHLNDLVANQIIRNTPAPMLKLDQKPNHVIVSHVNDVGDLMVQIPNEDLKFVQRSIVRIMSDSSEQHRVRYSDLLHDQLVCVCDESGDGVKSWYRGMLTAKPKSPEEEVFDVYYVDDGRLRKTHISNIYRLEANNLALASFPAQALRVRLHDVPPIDNQMVGRLRALLSPQTAVLIKVMEGTNDKLPMVTIYARGQDSLYLCVNSAVRMEYEVQSTTRLEPFDDGGLHFSPNGQLIRRSSFSSTVSSHSSCSDQPGAVGIVSPPSTPRKGLTALLPLLKEYEAIPALGAYFEVRVALSVNPGRFAVQPYKWYNQLQRMMKELQTHCKSTSAQTVLSTELTIGQPYAAADSDGIYHRVNIRKIYDEMIQLLYVDAGDDAVVRCNQLLQLPPEFRELPMMALPAQLYGIQLTGIDWTQENCVRFRKLTLGQKFIGVVRRVDKLKDGRRALSLELIDTSTPQDIKVHETLISEKHALPAP